MAEEFATVSVRQGALKGRRRRTDGGSAFVSFEGVPYAKPPVGALRFKAPQPPELWTGVRDATQVGNQCLHYDVLTKQILGDEDCLFLNIYTPKLPSESNKISLPVMAYIHGGGFAIGCGHIYGPEAFMDKDVVVVNFNYRLGPFGFLSLGTLEAPGNAGLKDQTMALRWVKENIAAFGGDPENVTIFGESAGAASVHYQLLSPLTKGLFHRVIAQSGSAFCPWAFTKDPVGHAKRLALAAGCKAAAAEDPVALAKWLREAPALTLVSAVDASVSEDETYGSKFLPFVPSVEPAHPEAFLPKTPAELVASGHVPKLPVIFGVTSHEGILFLPGSLLQFSNFRAPPGGRERTADELAAEEAKAMAAISSRPELLLPDDLPGRGDAQQEARLVQRFKDFFFDGQRPSEDTLPGLVNLYSDTQFVLGTLRAARDHAVHGSPVHVYEFAYSGRINFLSYILSCKVKGVSHADELSYLFNIPQIPQPEKGSQEELVRKRVVRLWTNYAKEGNPTPTLDDIITVKWPLFSGSAPNYLKINEELKAETGLFKERMMFWRDLYTKR